MCLDLTVTKLYSKMNDLYNERLGDAWMRISTHCARGMSAMKQEYDNPSEYFIVLSTKHIDLLTATIAKI